MFCTIGSHDTKCPVYGGAVSLWELDARISSHLSYTNDKLSKCEEKGSWDWGGRPFRSVENHFSWFNVIKRGKRNI